MRFSKEVESGEFFKTYLTVINGILHLTEKEIEVLAEFMLLQSDDTTLVKSPLLFGAKNRAIVRKQLGMSQYNLNNYIKSLKDKRILLENEDVLYINPPLSVLRDGDSVKIEVNLNISDKHNVLS